VGFLSLIPQVVAGASLWPSIWLSASEMRILRAPSPSSSKYMGMDSSVSKFTEGRKADYRPTLIKKHFSGFLATSLTQPNLRNHSEFA